MRIFITIILFVTEIIARNPDAVGKNGMVVSSHELASQVGIESLKNGGNAIDAAIATGFALSVLHPAAGNIGGGGFMVIRTANGEVTTIDFREVAPQSAHRDMYLDDGGEVIPNMSLYTTHAAGVPGTVAGFGYAHDKYGTKSWNYLLRPAIKLASNGFELSFRDAMYLNASRSFFLMDDEAAKIFASKERYTLGDLFIQRDLGKTLRRISVGGPEEFYTGVTANMIQDCMDRTGGIITKEELTNGPAKLTKALGINMQFNCISLSSNKIWIEDHDIIINKKDILSSSRIGVDYAGEDAKRPYRYYINNNKWISK